MSVKADGCTATVLRSELMSALVLRFFALFDHGNVMFTLREHERCREQEVR